MLKIEEIEGQNAVWVVSDDQNAENMALDEAIDMAAPHLHGGFEATDVEGGLLKWRVEADDYDSLLEVLDSLQDCNPDEVEAATELVVKLKKQDDE